MKVTCPNCRTAFRVDPRKVPRHGARARCSVCQGVFYVGPPKQPTAVESRAAAPAAPAAPAAASETVARRAGDAAPSPFAATDPRTKARRLARALVSDIVTYHPDRRDQSLREGTLKQEFKDEIRKSWEEYVGQVGAEAAHGSSHFQDALNDILARGEKVF